MMLYIDPGTGAMLFSLATGLLSALWFGVRKLYMSTKYMATGKAVKDKAKKDIVVYGEDKRYWTTFKGILEELDKSGLSVTYLAGSDDDPLLKESYQHVETKVIGMGNKAYARLNFLNAYVCLATTPGLGVYQWKRSRNVEWYAHITHSLGGGTAYRMFGTQFYDAVLLCSDVFTPLHRELEKKRGSASKEIVAVGQTYMDYLMERKEQTPVPAHEVTTVLVAPSWGTTSLLNRFGETLLDSLVTTGFDITLRPHPQSFINEKELMERLQEKYPESERFHWNRDADNFSVLNRSDIMISDFSGVIFDYVFVFGRPVIYAGGLPDDKVQDEAWLDGVYWGKKALPQIGRELKEAEIPLVGSIITEMTHSEKYVVSIQKVRDIYWQNRGHASEAVADYLIRKCESLKGNNT
ncbi:MAG: CDP-glycerol glycerophosphotransferase family protein [Bacteroidaceae bacterium]|nr:CDP-glycerol glycerophosphotransferase family protein [Bacteroidaceae bacterium]